MPPLRLRKGKGHLQSPRFRPAQDGGPPGSAAHVSLRLDLRGAVLVGHSTGGGEVARYIGRHGTGRVAKAVLLGAVPPLMLRTEPNPDGTRSRSSTASRRAAWSRPHATGCIQRRLAGVHRKLRGCGVKPLPCSSPIIAHRITGQHRDSLSPWNPRVASIMEKESEAKAEQRTWFLFEASRPNESRGPD
jgi:pimeloyl-ACP methyl ester carboxylesterase